MAETDIFRMATPKSECFANLGITVNLAASLMPVNRASNSQLLDFWTYGKALPPPPLGPQLLPSKGSKV